MIGYFVPILTIMFANILAVYLLKNRFGDSIPITFFISVFSVYFSQLLFGSFWPGIIFICLSALAGAVLLVIKRKEIRDLFFTYGMISFLFCCLFAFLLDYGRYFVDFDEFWHWGLMIKESLRLDSFHCVEASNMVIHKDYPPFCPLIELVWCRLGAGYSEGLATMGLHIFCLSIIVPVIAENICGYMDEHENGFIPEKDKRNTGITVKGVLYTILILISVLLIVLILDYAHTFGTILTDMPMGMIFAYTLYLVFSEKIYSEKASRLAFALGCGALILSKQAGAALMIVSVFAFIVFGIYQEYYGEKKYIRLIIDTAVFIMIPLLLLGLWKYTVSSHVVTDIRAAAGGNGQFNLSKIDLSAYIYAIMSEEQQLMHDTFWSFMKALLHRNVTGMMVIPISYISAFVILLVCVLVLHIKYSKCFTRNKAALVAGVYTIGTLGYAFMLSVLFLFCFTVDEMQELRGYERYVDGLLVGEYLSLFMLWCRLNMPQSKTFCKKILTFSVVLMVVANIRVYYLMPHEIQTIAAKMIHKYRDNSLFEETADYIAECTESGSRITLIYDTADTICNSGWYGGVQSYLQYYLNDRTLIWGMDLFNSELGDKDVMSRAMDQLKDSDYVFVMNLNNNIMDAFALLTPDGIVEQGRIYQVISDADSVVLQ